MWQKTKNLYHLSRAVASHARHGYPAKDAIVIGVTGTDGKTTTSSMIYHILTKAGKKVALVSTVAAIINGKPYDTGFHVTTPDAWQLPRYIKLARKAGAEYIVLETTSHALDQNRVYGIPFKIGVVTNITHDHLDYHKTYENYVSAKAKLLQMAEIAIVNKDDKSYEKLTSKVKNPLTYGLDSTSDINPQSFPFKNTLLGDFNTYNCLAAIAVCLQLGIEPDTIRQALLDFTAPEGRAEIVYDKEFQIMIDFAHTPNSIEQILSSIKKIIHKPGRIIHVFGTAGRRDVLKRPFMGKASDTYADIIILTAEDPRDEKIETIFQQLEEGIINYEKKLHEKSLYEIANRQLAINQAIALAKKGDVVVITGKGHEKSMNLGKGEDPWSDHIAVKNALSLRL